MIKVFVVQGVKISLGLLIVLYELFRKGTENYCYASKGTLIPGQNKDGVIMVGGQQYDNKNFMNVDMWLTLFIFIYCLMHIYQLVVYIKPRLYAPMSHRAGFYFLAIVMLVYFRFKHETMVCLGDYKEHVLSLQDIKDYVVSHKL